MVYVPVQYGEVVAQLATSNQTFADCLAKSGLTFQQASSYTVEEICKIANNQVGDYFEVSHLFQTFGVMLLALVVFAIIIRYEKVK